MRSLIIDHEPDDDELAMLALIGGTHGLDEISIEVDGVKKTLRLQKQDAEGRVLLEG